MSALRIIGSIAVGAIATGAPLASCQNSPVQAPVRPSQTIYVPEDYDVQFNAESGDTVIVIMYPDGNPESRCDSMGGETIFNPFTLIWTCEDVDF